MHKQTEPNDQQHTATRQGRVQERGRIDSNGAGASGNGPPRRKKILTDNTENSLRRGSAPLKTIKQEIAQTWSKLIVR